GTRGTSPWTFPKRRQQHRLGVTACHPSTTRDALEGRAMVPKCLGIGYRILRRFLTTEHRDTEKTKESQQGRRPWAHALSSSVFSVALCLCGSPFCRAGPAITPRPRGGGPARCSPPAWSCRPWSVGRWRCRGAAAA